MTAPPVLATVVRDGVVESVHRGHLAVVDAEGTVLAGVGDPAAVVYARSSVKPLQALATLQLLADAGVADQLGDAGLAIACASHAGTDVHQIEAAHLLALAGLDESALRCPPALPSDIPALLVHGEATRLAHNCSGKHAAFIWAQAAAGADPAAYLDVDSRIQQQVREHLAAVTGAAPEGPGVDGCGAPAWRLPLAALATGFARLAAPRRSAAGGGAAAGCAAGLERVRSAMTAHPDLVGGAEAADTMLMRADRRVVAKRGAEAVLAVGVAGVGGAGRPVGVGVKIADGGPRAGPPAVAAVLEALGVSVPRALGRPVVLGGGRPHGWIEADRAIAAAAHSIRG
jgi:L-asparaginase II